jgi:hypothetical protein
MAHQHSIHQVGPNQPATVLLVDLRNFTPNLNAATPDSEGVSGFCHFLSAFYAKCLDTCLLALPAELRDDPPLYLSSTGDGVLVVFTHEANVRHGYLAAMLLHQFLRPLCESYNHLSANLSCPSTSFGVGIESGDVNRITSQRINRNDPSGRYLYRAVHQCYYGHPCHDKRSAPRLRRSRGAGTNPSKSHPGLDGPCRLNYSDLSGPARRRGASAHRKNVVTKPNKIFGSPLSINRPPRPISLRKA